MKKGLATSQSATNLVYTELRTVSHGNCLVGLGALYDTVFRVGIYEQHLHFRVTVYESSLITGESVSCKP